MTRGVNIKRQTTIALVAAGLIGTTAGVVVTVGGPELPVSRSSATPVQPSVTPSATKTSGSSSSPTPSGTPFGIGVAKDNTPLLYVAKKKIHDGENVVAIDGISEPRVISVYRFVDNYLASTLPSSGRTNLYLVDVKGNSQLIAVTGYSYDLNLAKDRFVAVDVASKRVVIWDSEGKVIHREEEAIEDAERTSVGFVEDEVAIISAISANKQSAVRWNPETSKITKIASPQLSGVSISPGGSFMAGDTLKGNDGRGCLGVSTDKRVNKFHEWKACDWRSWGNSTLFSPDGSKVLAVPNNTEGYGPGELAAFVVRNDGRKPDAAFQTPDDTADAVWADDNRLWLTGPQGGDYQYKRGAWIKLCAFDGGCQTVATTDKGNVVLGGGVY